MSTEPAVAITMPDLGIPADAQVTVSAWLVAVGERVFTGDRLIELLWEEITFDVPSPIDGRLTRRSKAIDELVRFGDVLGYIQRG